MLKTAKAMPTKIDVIDGDWTTEEVLVAVKCHEDLLAHAIGRMRIYATSQKRSVRSLRSIS